MVWDASVFSSTASTTDSSIVVSSSGRMKGRRIHRLSFRANEAFGIDPTILSLEGFPNHFNTSLRLPTLRRSTIMDYIYVK